MTTLHPRFLLKTSLLGETSLFNEPAPIRYFEIFIPQYIHT